MTDNAPTPRSIALYGGSFNPPHVGHVMVGAWVLSATDVDELWVMPTWDHAFAKELVDYDVRCEMCRAAFSALDDARIQVSDVERMLGGESRTIDTVEYIQQHLGITDIRIVIGTDIWQERHLWKRWDDLINLCAPILIGRDGYPNPPGETVSPALIDVSSTQIRAGLRRGQHPEVLPVEVSKIIEERGLYGG